ncbi:MAG: hypothetical protein ACI4HJ_06255 [Ruminococcus sp.]|nr:hypothetical protein [Oscillospiraceae bacterium]
MKKVLALVMVLALTIFAFAGCAGATKVTKCEICGEEKQCKQITYQGESGWFCVDTCAPFVEGMLKSVG